MKDNNLGIYIHIPFCERKCRYCDFLSFNADEPIKESYVEALLREIKENPHTTRTVDTIFFGGGTPSVLPARLIARILDELRKSFNVREDAEITVECNPGTVDDEKLKIYKSARVNRISFGLQSADDAELEMLGRIHNFEDFKESFLAAKEAGFENINVDIMMALPGQLRETLFYTIEEVTALGPKHISMYSLILEEGTPLKESLPNLPPLPSEDKEREMYKEATKLLKSKGYGRYEISNYSKPGFESRHNIRYWQLDEYLGFGIGAASFTEGKRFSNTESIEDYIKTDDFEKIKRDVTILSKEDLMGEFMFLGLRMMRGVSGKDFYERFGEDMKEVFADAVKAHLQDGTLKVTEEGFSLTERGIDVSNYVMADFV